MKKITNVEQLFELPAGSILEIRGLECSDGPDRKFKASRVLVIAVPDNDGKFGGTCQHSNFMGIGLYEGKRFVIFDVICAEGGYHGQFMYDTPSAKESLPCDEMFLLESNDVIELFMKLFSLNRDLEQFNQKAKDLLGDR